MALLSASLEQVILCHWEDLDTSFSLKCAIMARYGDWESLVRLECRPEDYDTPERYFRSVAALALVKKLPCLPIQVDRVAVARQKWWDGEISCYKSNQRLYPYLPGLNLERDDRIAQHLAGVREVVRELIGVRPPPLVEGRFGPGATFADRGLRTTVPDKISNSPTLTSDGVWFLPQFFGTAWGRYTAAEKDLVFVRGNRFTTVPKTSLTDRSIAIEPSINVFFQLAYGRSLRERLMGSHGWNLDTAQSVHRLMVKDASVSREFATLDLSNASDTVSRVLVKLLLPHDWHEVLSFLRSPVTSGVLSPTGKPGCAVLEKFSSMGNGYTFELETVLFSAIAIYCSRLKGYDGRLGKDVFVFGDDIIIKDDVTKDLTAMLAFLGFRVNDEKSFSGLSPFRESCGADFYNGVDVRPAYLKDEPANVKDSIGVANRLHTNGQRLAAMGGSLAMRAWNRAVRSIPLPFRHLYGPQGLGDNVIWRDESWWHVRWRNSIRHIRALKPGKVSYVSFGHFKPDVVLACALYGTGNVGTPEKGRVPDHEGVTPRDAIKSYRVGWMTYS